MLKKKICWVPPDWFVDVGCLCQPFDVQELSNKLLSMMNNVELRQKMGLSDKQSAHSFNKDIVMGQWINLFKSITNTK